MAELRYQDWRIVLDAYQTPVAIDPAEQSTTFILNSNDGQTRTVFTGTGFTYDANGLPTGGVIDKIELQRMFDGAPMQRMESIDISLGDVGTFIRESLDLRGVLSPLGVVDAITGIEGQSAGSIVLRNGDGTFTVIEGTGLAVNGAEFVGTVDRVVLRDVDNSTEIGSVVVGAGIPLTRVFSALSGDTAGEELFKLLGQGTTAVTGLLAYVDDNTAEPNVVFENMWDTAGNDTYVGEPDDGNSATARTAGVDFGHATSSVIADLSAGTVVHTGIGDVDTLVGISGVIGSEFADTLSGSDKDNGLGGRGGDDVLSGGAGNDILSGGLGDDTIDGGEGIDTAIYRQDEEDNTQGVFVSLSAGQSAGDLGVDTLISIENLVGSKFGDTLIGDENDNELAGLDGGDVLQGGGGNDTLKGGAGVDYLYGDEGNDTLEAGSVTFDAYGNALEILVGGAGADVLIAGPSPSIHYMVFYGNETGSLGVAVNLSAGTATDTFGDTDQLVDVFGVGGTNQADTLTGSDTDDVFAPGGGTDVIDGGGGFDLISYAYSAATVSDGFGFTKGIVVTMTGAGSGSIADPTSATDTFTGIEEIWGTRFDDLFTGAEGNDRFMGEAGADHFDGGAGVDTVTYFREAYSGGIAGVVVNLFTGTASDGFTNADTLVGIENIVGTQFGDSIVGDAADNTLEGGAGDDGLEGGLGNDVLDGGEGNDTAYYNQGPEDLTQGVTVSLAVSGPQNTGETGLDTLISIENLVGSHLGDQLTGDTGDNVLSGLGGDDVIIGGGGFDTLDGGEGNDSLNAEAGQIFGGGGNDTITSVGAEVFAGSGNDLVQLISAPIGSAAAPAAPVADGGEGFDTLRINSTGIADFTKLANFENWEVRPAHSITLTDENIGEASELKVGVAVGVHGTTGPGLTVDGSAVGAGSLVLSGSGRADVLIGGSASDHLLGSHSNDTLTGGSGDDYIDGGEDVDTAVFSGNQDDYYTTLHADGSFTIVDTRDPGFDDGSDKLIGIEFLQFADGTVDAADYAKSHSNDKTAPQLFSITNTGPATTNAEFVQYRITFSESVTGVELGDFTLNSVGLSDAKIVAVTAVDGSEDAAYIVTVDTGTGTGSLSLKFSGGGIADLAGNRLLAAQVVAAPGGVTADDRGLLAERALTADGTKVLFTSGASTLVGGDSNSLSDVFIRDLTTGNIQLISTGTNGISDGESYAVAISPDGSKVAFSSFATNLVADTNDGSSHLYLKDLVTGELTVIAGDAGSVQFSADSKSFVYSAWLPEIGTQVMFKNLTTGQNLEVSSPSSGLPNGESFASGISADGTKVLFVSYADNLVSGDTNGREDLFIRDLATGVAELFSPSSTVTPNASITGGAYSADGSKLLFWTEANNLVPEDTDAYYDLYIKDLATGDLTLVSSGPAFDTLQFVSGMQIAADGTKVAFLGHIEASAGDFREYAFVKNLVTGDVTRVISGNDWAFPALSLSADGSTIAVNSDMVLPGSFEGPNAVVVDISGAPSFRSPTITITGDTPTLEGRNVVENSANGTVIGRLSDADPRGALTQTYELIDNAGGAFGVVNGNIVVADKTLIDFEAAQSHVVTVRVTDGSGSSTDKSFAINVSDQNDNGPTIATPAELSVAEGETHVAELTSDDPDNVGVTTWAITGGADAALFDIVDGKLVFKVARDYETDVRTYEVEVTASQAIQDGDADVIGVRPEDGMIALFRNDGGVFEIDASAFGVEVPDGVNPRLVVDFDGDGDHDLFAMTYSTGERTFFRNEGGIFVPDSSPFTNVTLETDFSLNLIDADGDGDLDAFGLASSGTERGFFRNDGGVFVADNGVFSGDVLDAAHPAAFLDFDGDGDQDAFGLTVSSNVYAYFRNDVGVFVADETPFSNVSLQLFSPHRFVDFDGDGDLDFFGRQANSPQRGYFRNDDGVFVADSTPFSNVTLSEPGSTILLDFDQDGDLDGFAITPDGKSSYLRNDEGVFSIDASPFANVSLSVDGGDFPHFVDFDGDGDADFFGSSTSGQQGYWRNDGGVFVADPTPFANAAFDLFRDVPFIDSHRATDTKTITVTLSDVNEEQNTAPAFGSGTGFVTTDISGNDAGTNVMVQADGKVVVAGYAANSFALTRYNADGSLDTSFGTGGKVTTSFGSNTFGWGASLDGEGRIVVGGSGNFDFALARYNADGSLDTTFGTTGLVTTNVGFSLDEGQNLAIQPDGKIILTGYAYGGDREFALVRYNSDGSLDATFNGTGIVKTAIGTGMAEVRDVLVQPDGKIVVTGYANGPNSDFAIARYNSNGTLDTTFGNGGSGYAIRPISFTAEDEGRSIALQSDGMIVVAGFVNNGTDTDFAVLRYTDSGSLDAMFGISLGAAGIITTPVGSGDDQAFAIAIQGDGKLIVAGRSSDDFAVLRYNSDGTLDETFGSGGKAVFPIGPAGDGATSIVLQPDGKILVSGYASNGSNNDFALVRLNADGSLDTTFNAVNSLGGTVAYTQGGPAVVLDGDVAIFDAELVAAGSYDGASLTLHRTGTADAGDVFGASGPLAALTEGGDVTISGTVIGTVTQNSGGAVILTFNAAATQAFVNDAMRLVTYANTSASPPASAEIGWTFSDGNTGAQGSGGALSASGSTTVNITPLANQAPAFAPEAGEFTPLGSANSLNEHTAGNQYIPFISNLASDKFLVTWIDVDQGLRMGQVLDAQGNKEGGEFSIMNATNGYDSEQIELADGRVAVLSFTGPTFGKLVNADGTVEPLDIAHMGNQSGYMKVTALAGGGFVVAASVNGYTDIGAQAYDGSGAIVGPQYTIPSGTFNEYVTKDVVALADGGYVLFFDQAGGGLKAQRFDGQGSQVGSVYDVGELATDLQGLENINSDRLPDGRIVVSWAQPDEVGTHQVFARILDVTGAPSGPAFIVNEGTASGQFPKVTVTSNGNFAILWSGEGGFRVQLFDGDGSRIGDDVIVSPMVAIPWVAYATPTTNGGIFYAWRGIDDSGEGALGRLLNADGSFGSDVLNLGPTTNGDQFGERSAVNSKGVLVALSTDNSGADGSGYGVFFQVFQVPGIGDSSGAVTEDGQGGTLTDTGTLTFTDADSADTHTASASYVSSTYTSQLGTLTANVIKDSTGGATGEVTWTYNVDDEAVRFLKAGETIVETYTIALDDGNGATDSQTITIAIHGKNEPPTDLTLTGSAVDENSKGGTTVGTLAAIGGGVSVTFTLTDDAGGLFVLDGNVLKVADGATLDHEASATQSVTVEVSEGGSEPVSRTFEIAVSDVNEAPDTLLVEGNEVEENSVPGTVVATLSATDPDEGDDTLTFSLLNNAAGLFAIVGDQIVVAEDAILDHEAAGQHTLTVEVKDAGGLSRSQDITISVLDLPEAPTDFTYTGGELVENAVAGTVVATLSAKDQDAGDQLTYTLSSDPSGLFEIVGNQVRVAAGALIDYEEATEHTITVEVSDSTGNSLEQDIVVAVENVFGSFVGTSGNDTYAGTSEEDYVYGRKGNDTLSGGAGNDEIYGEEGNDTLSGGAGTDYVAGGLGNDTYLIDESDVEEDTLVEYEGEGVDTIKLAAGFASDYTLQDGFENLIAQGANSITLTGNDAANVITGNTGNNLIDGGAGADAMKGGLGNDIYVVDDAGDKVTELSSQGTDEIRTTLDVYSLAALGNVENLAFIGSGSFAGTGNSRNNVITGGSGSDVLDGKAGADTLVGGFGDDAYYIDNAADVIVEGAEEGTDTVYASISYTLGADLEQLVLIGTAAINGTGNAKDNYILGNRAANTLDGGAGADVLSGDFGNDIYIVDNEGDQVIEDAGQGTDTIRTSLTAYNLSATGHLENVENLTYTGSDSFFGHGNAGNNVITGGHGGNTLVGGGGNDMLIGGDGADQLDGGLGGDTMRGGKGDDIYVVDDLFDRTIKFDAFDRVIEKAGEGIDTVNASVDYTLGANVENLVLFGSAVKGTGNGLANAILGNNLANTLSGAGGDDILIGEGGADTLLGGSGNDRLVISDETFVLVDGGTGQDVLAFRSALSLDLTAIANSAIRGIEALDISGSAGDDNFLVLGVDDVRSMSTLSNATLAAAGFGPISAENLVIFGNAGDGLSLAAGQGTFAGGAWSKVGEVTIGGEVFDVHNYVRSGTILATVAADQDVVVV